MKTFDLGKHREARIWAGVLPEATFSSASTLRGTVPLGGQAAPSRSGRQSFGIEYKTNLGGRIGYGLLGSTFAPTRADHLTLSVPIKNEAWASFSTPLYLVDTVYIGLPEDLGRWVLDGTLKYFIDQPPLTGGELNFGAAAFSEVGSSPDIFSRLAAATCRYFAMDNDTKTVRSDSNFDEVFSMLTEDVR